MLKGIQKGTNKAEGFTSESRTGRRSSYSDWESVMEAFEAQDRKAGQKAGNTQRAPSSPKTELCGTRGRTLPMMFPRLPKSRWPIGLATCLVWPGYHAKHLELHAHRAGNALPDLCGLAQAGSGLRLGPTRTRFVP